MLKDLFVIFVLSFVFSLFAIHKTEAQVSVNKTLNESIPFDSSVKTGVLGNGIKYYIKNNSKPEDKVELRLVINVGSILEDDDQQGLAHFMEHMNFNGLKHFKKNELVDYLQSIGVKFGAHLNAYTGFDKTVYILPIPSDDPEKLEKGFLILGDWAHNALLTGEEIDKERGVVLEEYRLGLGAEKRMLNKYLPKIMYNSRYSERLPIGKKDIIENFTHDKIRRFYKDWYRPDLMAVVAVGDVSVEELEKKIIKHFSHIPSVTNPRERKEYDVPNHKETIFAIESDKEAMFSQVNLVYKDKGKPEPLSTIEDYKSSLIDNLFSSMINARFRELADGNDPPFVFGFSFHGQTWAKTKEAYQCRAMAPEKDLLKALEALITENERVLRFGFVQGELDRAKASIVVSLEKALSEKDKTKSSRFANEYINHFLDDEPVPGVQWEFDVTKSLLPNISVNDVNDLIKEFIHEENRVVVITGPEKEDIDPISEKEVLQLFEKVKNINLSKYEDTEVAASLLASKPNSGTITKEDIDIKTGVTTLVLSNGARVLYKKTDFKNDEVLFSAYSPGGSNMFDDENFFATDLAIDGLSDAGVNGFSKSDINKMMKGKVVKLSPFIRSTNEGFRGSCRPKDTETLFQYVYSYFTGLNKNEDSYKSFAKKQMGFLKNLASNPNVFFQVEMSKYINQDSRNYGLPQEKDWLRNNYNIAFEKYQERFANAGDFTFYFVGNIDLELIKEYSSNYLASLPSKGAADKIVDRGVRPIKGIASKNFFTGTEPKSSVSIRYNGESSYNSKEAYALKSLGEILTIKLVEKLREEESGVYGVSANGRMSRLPYNSYSFSIGFPCGPENVASLIKSAINQVDLIKRDGPTDADLHKIKEAQLLEYKEKMKENKYWMSKIKNADMHGEDLNEIYNTVEVINNLTKKDIQNAANKFLNENRVIGTLYPLDWEEKLDKRP